MEKVTPIDKKERINHPPHYNKTSVETIDIIEETIADAPNPVLGNSHANVLRYLLRLWLKEVDPLVDAKKAQWYLNRMIEKLEAATESDE